MTSHKKTPVTNARILAKAAKSLGYTITKINPKAFGDGLYLSDGKKTCFINKNVFYPSVPRWQHEFMGSKLASERILKKAGYSSIQSKLVYVKNFPRKSDVLQYIKNIPLPVIVKPESGLKGKGIDVAYTQKQLNTIVSNFYAQGVNCIIQQLLDLDEYRILVVNGKIEIINGKEFPIITGDGKSSIKKLLTEKMEHHLNDNVLEKSSGIASKYFDTVLAVDETIQCHVTKKASPDMYISKNIPPKIEQWAEDLCTKLSITTVGIDAFIEGTIDNPKRVIIIELNSNPAISYIQTKYNDTKTALRIAQNALKAYFD